MTDEKCTFHLASFRVPSKNPDSDALDDMVATANQFRDASIRCFNSTVPIAEQNQLLVFPHVVCGCFACEMYLKFLLKKDGKKAPRNHSLIELWAMQSDIIKNGFQAKYITTNIDDLIRSISDHFIKIRYNHEMQMETVHFGEDKLAMILPYLSDVCNK